MAAGDLAQAWALLQLESDYRAAWQAHAARPVYEDGTTFPVRIRSDADRIVERDWSLLAWADPDGDAVSAFFDVPMLEGEGSMSASPLLPMLDAAGARIEGLRLDGGALVLKVEDHGMAVQVRIADPSPLLAGGGVRLFHDWGLALPAAIARLGNLWSVSGGGSGEDPSAGSGPSPRHGIGGRAHGVESATGAVAVGEWGVAVSGGFRNAGASFHAIAPFPVAAHQTGRAVCPHPAFGRDHAFALGRPMYCCDRRVRPYSSYSRGFGKRP